MGRGAVQAARAFDEHVTEVDRDAAVEYAMATNDDDPRYRNGSLTPPTFGYVVARDAYRPSLDAMIPEEWLPRTVQAAHDLWIHHPLRAGQKIASRMVVLGTRVGPSGTRITVKVSSRDANDDQPMIDQYSVVLIRGFAGGPDSGVEGPDHAFPESARANPIARVVITVDGDQATRYARATGDNSPIHMDPDVARAAGLPGVILQGMCTVALTGRALLGSVANGDGARLKRLAVRFSKPLLPGSDVETSVYDAGTLGDDRVYAFEASSNGHLVLSNGRAQVSAQEERT